MDYFNGILQQDFNKLYPDLVNNKITHPPYLKGRVPYLFYLTKRPAFSKLSNYGEDILFDATKYGADDLYIAGDFSAGTVQVKKGNSVLNQTPLVEGVTCKFFYGSGVKGSMVEQGSGANGEVVGTDVYLVDTTKNWTPNAYINHYVYVYDGDAGVGQVFKIAGNTDTKLDIGEFKVNPSNVNYKIFESYGDILYFTSSDGLYGIHGDTSQIIKAEGFGKIKDAIYTGGSRFVVLDENSNILIGGKGRYGLFVDNSSLIGTVEKALNIVEFQEYILVLSRSKIDVIKQGTIVIGSEQLETFTLSNGTREFGLFTNGALSTYNQGLYIVNSNRKFVSVNIRAISDNKFVIDASDEGVYIQQYLDNLDINNNIRIYIDSTDIKIIINQGEKSIIHIFDFYYKGWHRWEMDFILIGYTSEFDIYYGSEIFDINSESTADLDGIEIIQRIRLIFGEETFTSLKVLYFLKLVLGKGTSRDIKVNIDIFFGSFRSMITRLLSGAKSLYSSVLGENGGTLGESILGLGLLGNTSESVQVKLPSVFNVKIPLGITAEMVIIDLVGEGENKIIYGGQIVGYSPHPIDTTDPQNVI